MASTQLSIFSPHTYTPSLPLSSFTFPSYNWVSAAVKRGVPIEGIGLQVRRMTRDLSQMIMHHMRADAHRHSRSAATGCTCCQHQTIRRSRSTRSCNRWPSCASTIQSGKHAIRDACYSEMDVRCQPPCDLQRQAEIYASIVDVCLNQSSVCTAFTTWGFTDLHTCTLFSTVCIHLHFF